MKFLKTLQIASLTFLSCSAIAAAPADKTEHKAKQDKSGFTIGIGVSNIGGDAGDALDSIDAKRTIPELDISYTTKSGGFFGLTTSMMNDASGRKCYNTSRWYSYCNQYDFEYGTGSLYGGYETDMGVRILAGYSFVYVDGDIGDYTTRSSIVGGPMVGVGYTIKKHYVLKATYAPSIEDDGIKGSLLSASLAYKF